jgi:hypothetical protein
MLNDNRASILRTLFYEGFTGYEVFKSCCFIAISVVYPRMWRLSYDAPQTCTILWCIAFSDIKFTTYGVCDWNETWQHSTDAAPFGLNYLC